MSAGFRFDLYLSHSSRDDAVARPLAERLRADGFRVWIDAFELEPDGCSDLERIEEGLRQSRVLVLCMSAQAFGPDWPRVGASTVRFRDPLSRERRLIPLRLDDAPVPDFLAGFPAIDWRSGDPELRYSKLVEACRSPATPRVPEGEPAREHVCEKASQLDCKGMLYAYAFSADRKRVLASGGADNDLALRLWDVATGRCLRTIEGHEVPVGALCWSRDERFVVSAAGDGGNASRVWDLDAASCRQGFHARGDWVWSVASSGDGRHVVTGDDEGEVRLWEIETGRCLRSFAGHRGHVTSLVWSSDQNRILSASDDHTLRLWDVASGRCLRVLEGETEIWCIAEGADDRRALSGDNGGLLRLWDVESGRCVRALAGHVGCLLCVAWSPDGRLALSGSDDATVRLWDVERGRCLRVLERHRATVRIVAWSADGRRAYSGDESGEIRIWDMSEFVEPQ